MSPPRRLEPLPSRGKGSTTQRWQHQVATLSKPTLKPFTFLYLKYLEVASEKLS